MSFRITSPRVFVPVEIKQHFSFASSRTGLTKGCGQLGLTILKHRSKISVMGGKWPGILIDRIPPKALAAKIRDMLVEDESEGMRLIYGLSTEPEAITFSTSNWNNPDSPTFTITKDEPHLSRMIKLLSGDWDA